MIEQKLNYQKLGRIQRMGQTADLPLFDGPQAVDMPTLEPTDARDVRNAAYYSLTPGKLNHNEMLVYGVIMELGTPTDREIARQLGWEINRVTGRRNALVKKGRVERYGTKQVAGRTQTMWRVAR